MTNRHMKRCLISLIIREMQIKTTMRYNCTPIRMATINKLTNNKWWCGCWIKGILMHCWWECRLVLVTVQNIMEIPQNIKNSLWSSNSTYENVFKDTQNTNLKGYMHSYVHCIFIYNIQDLEASQTSISRLNTTGP